MASGRTDAFSAGVSSATPVAPSGVHEWTKILTNEMTTCQPPNEYRRYQSATELSAVVNEQVQRSRITHLYRIGAAWGGRDVRVAEKTGRKIVPYLTDVQLLSAEDQKQHAVRLAKAVWFKSRTRAGRMEPAGRRPTPAVYAESLRARRPRQTYVPEFGSYNLDFMVYGGAMLLSAMTNDEHFDLSFLVPECGLNVTGNVNPNSIDDVNISECYIERGFGRRYNGYVWPIAVLLANLSGSGVVTDSLLLSSNGIPDIKLPRGSFAWTGLSGLLACLANYYQVAGDFDIFCLWFFKGLHSGSTVVAHTDEGGLMRDILRVGSPPPCYGGLPSDVLYYPSIAVLGLEARYSNLAKWVDSYLLMSAGLVAHCDPGALGDDGRFRSSIFSVEEEYRDVAPDKYTADTVESMVEGMLVKFGSFAEDYMRGLHKILGEEADTSSKRAATIFADSARDGLISRDGIVSRHIRMRAIVPYYWIEPTSILPSRFLGTAAEIYLQGSWCSATEIRHLPMCPGWVADSPNENSVVGRYSVPLVDARANPLFTWMYGAKSNALGRFNIIKAQPDKLVLHGAGLGDDCAVKMCAGATFADMPWTRGDSGMPCPGECTYLATCIRVLVRHEMSWLGHEERRACRSLPSSRTLLDTMIRIESSALFCDGSGTLSSAPSEVRRARARAFAAMHCASSSNYAASLFNDADVHFTVGDGDLTAAAPRHGWTDVVNTPTRQASPANLHNKDPDIAEGSSSRSSPAVARALGSTVKAVAGAVPPTTVHQSQGGPVASRAMAAQGTGGAPAAPPPGAHPVTPGAVAAQPVVQGGHAPGMPSPADANAVPATAIVPQQGQAAPQAAVAP